jgi:hypothetical protein
MNMPNADKAEIMPNLPKIVAKRNASHKQLQTSTKRSKELETLQLINRVP